MRPLYMIELKPDMAALYRFLGNTRLRDIHQDEDLGYSLHTWMTAAFGDLAPKPWRVYTDRRRPTKILAYSSVSAQTLTDRMCEFADPSVLAVCPTPVEHLMSKPMPLWREGRHLAFDIRLCPIQRTAREGTERDAFLMQLETGAHSQPRTEIYTVWAQAQIEREQAVKVIDLKLTSFRLVRQMRRGRNTQGNRSTRFITRPQITVQGQLVICDPDKFSNMLAKGVGRHRAFGYGMVLLRPSYG